MRDGFIKEQWPEVVSRLSAHLDLTQTAYADGAFRQARGVPDAPTLLRLALAWGACGLSLRETAAWAEVNDIAHLSDAALSMRLAGAGNWLGDIASALVGARLASPGRGKGFRLRLVDATSLCHPGADRTSWRLHVSYDLEAGRIDGVALTDVKGGESLRRFEFQKGDIVLADAGYPKPGDLRPVIQNGAHLVVRLGWHSLRLLTPDGGSSFDLFGALRGMAGSEGAFVVRVDDHQPNLEPLLLRLVVWRKDEKSREIARWKVQKHARKVGKKPDARTLEAADYVLLLTSLPADAFTPAEVLGLYRFRWQIELAFKRWKSILQLGNLPAKSPQLARMWIYAKVIAGLLIEDHTAEVLELPPPADNVGSIDPLGLAYR